MHNTIWGIICLLLFSLSSYGQKHTISGYIKDASSGEDLIGANVIITSEKKGTTTNTYGFYSLSLPEGKYTVCQQCHAKLRPSNFLHQHNF